MDISKCFKLVPYSTYPGDFCLLPYSPFAVRIFPTSMEICHLDNCEYKTIAQIRITNLKIFLHNFIIYNNLEKGSIQVFLQKKSSVLRYEIFYSVKSRLIIVKVIKNALAPLSLILESSQLCWHHLETSTKTLQSNIATIDKKQSIGLVTKTKTDVEIADNSREKLLLGVHKALDCRLLWKRLALREMLPIIFYSANFVPKNFKNDINENEERSPVGIIDECYKYLKSNKKYAEELLKYLVITKFSNMFVPHSKDVFRWGTTANDDDIHPLLVLWETKRLIKNIFVKRNRDCIDILPNLLPEFFCGELYNVNFGEITLLMKWQKKSIRKVVLFSETEQSITLKLHRGVNFFRMYKNRSKKYSYVKSGENITLQKNTCYVFDNFTKLCAKALLHK